MFPILLLAIFGWQPTSAAEVTEGPEAYISIHKQGPWASARSCAAGCLRYNGVFGCNNAGFNDLGRTLGCGCSPSNNCYCSSKFASSATSYVVECVSTDCAGIQDWAEEATSMLQIYNDYCATANVAVSTPGFSFGPTTTPTEDAAASTPTKTNPGATRATKTGSPGAASTSDSTATPGSDGEKKDGLSQSDIVALAASLGVGIPSLLVAIITLVVQMRKRKRRAAERESGAPPAAASNVHLIHLHTPTPTPAVQPPPQYQTPPPQQQYNTTTWSYELDAPKEGNQRHELK